MTTTDRPQTLLRREMALFAKARAALVHPRFVGVLAIAAFATRAVSLGSGFLVDDYTHRFFARGQTIPGGPRGVWDMYRFADGGSGVRRAIDEGLHPWWTSPSLKLAFLRPITSLVRWAEEMTFGDHAVGPHLLSCAIFVATVLLLHAAFRRWLGGATAALAALLFAIDDAHATTVTWIAARHALLGALAVAGSLLLFVRAREVGRVSYGAGVCLLLGLLSSEATLSALPLFVAIGLAASGRPSAARISELLPLAGAVVCWGLLYAALGYGASSSSYYIDPVHDPLRFARALALRLPALAAAQLFVPPSELASMNPTLAPAIALFGAAVLAAGALLAWRSPERRSTLALYFAFIASLVPACGTNADDRLLMVPAIAGVAFLAVVSRDAYRASRAAARMQLAPAAVLATVGLVHVVFALLLGPPRALLFARSMGGFVERGAEELFAVERPSERDLILVTSPDGLLPTSMALSRQVAGAPVARSMTILVTAPEGDVRLTRDDAATLTITATRGMMRDPFVGAVRDGLFRQGETVSTERLDVHVKEVTPDGNPLSLVFRFHAALDRPELAFMQWTAQGPHGRPGYAPLALPAQGETVPLTSIAFVDAVKPQ